jgi:hypothetical protein
LQNIDHPDDHAERIAKVVRSHSQQLILLLDRAVQFRVAPRQLALSIG